MKRYNGQGHANPFAQDILVDVGPQYSADAIASIPGMTDDELSQAASNGDIPAYCAPSVTDRTFFNPANSALQNALAFAPRRAIYDSVDGKIQELNINLGWLRNPARDRTEIDYALEVVKSAVERAKANDEAAIKELTDKQKDMEELASAIKLGAVPAASETSSES